MFSLIRSLVVLVICLVGIGLYRGWFSLANAARDPETHKVNISVSVDADKMKADARKVKTRITEEVAQRVKQLDEPSQTQTVK
jgi:hypothetical protein